MHPSDVLYINFSKLDVVNFEHFAIYNGKVVFKVEDKLMLVEDDSCSVFTIASCNCNHLYIIDGLVFYGDSKKALDIEKKKLIERIPEKEFTFESFKLIFKFAKLADGRFKVYIRSNDNHITYYFYCDFRAPFVIKFCVKEMVKLGSGDDHCYIFQCYDCSKVYYMYLVIDHKCWVKNCFIIDFLLSGIRFGKEGVNPDSLVNVGSVKIYEKLNFEGTYDDPKITNFSIARVYVSESEEPCLLIIKEGSDDPLVAHCNSEEKIEIIRPYLKVMSGIVKGRVKNDRFVKHVKIVDNMCEISGIDTNNPAWLHPNEFGIDQQITDKLYKERKIIHEHIASTDLWIDSSGTYFMLPFGIGKLKSRDSNAQQQSKQAIPEWYKTDAYGGYIDVIMFFPRKSEYYTLYTEIFKNIEGDLSSILSKDMYKHLNLNNLNGLPDKLVERLPCVINCFFDILMKEETNVGLRAMAALKMTEFFRCDKFYHCLILYLIHEHCEQILVINVIMRVPTSDLFGMMERYFADNLCKEVKYLYDVC